METAIIRSVTLGCVSKGKYQKDHSSDDEADTAVGLQNRCMNEYDSIQEESRLRSLEEEDFLL